MTESPSHAELPSPAGAPLVRWLLLLATGLLVAWCVPRVKPVLWFGPLFGLLTGVIAIGLERWFGQPSARRQTVLTAVCAMLGCAAVFGIAIQAAERTNKPNPKDAAAEALLRSMEQGSKLSQDEPSPPGSIRPNWFTTAEWYAAMRYRNRPGPAVGWLVAEIASAGLTAGLLHALMNRRWRPNTEAAP